MVVFLFLLIGVIELLFSQGKLFLYRRYRKPYEHLSERDMNAELYLLYYKKLQQLNIFRVVSIVVVVVCYILYMDIGLLNVFGIAVGAIILTFQSYIVGFAMYFEILTSYKVGQTVKIGDYQGEIIAIKPQHLGISGLNERGEHNGKLYMIPMSEVKKMVITRIDLRQESVEKVIMALIYKRQHFHQGFVSFVVSFEGFLDVLLKKNTLASAGHYESYIGYKYKLNTEYTDTGDIRLSLGFLCKQKDARMMRRTIIEWVEEQKFC